MKKVIVDRDAFYSAMIGVVLVMIAQGVVSPHINFKVLKDMGLFYVSLLTLGFMIARSVSSLIHAVLYSKLSARTTGLIGLALLGICYISYIYFPTRVYPFVRFLEGFSAGLFWPLLQSLIVNGVHVDRRSGMMSIYFLIGSISGYIGYQLGSIFYIYIGSSSTIYIGFIILVVYGIIYFPLAPTRREVRKDTVNLKMVIMEIRKVKESIPIMILTGGVHGLLKDFLFAYTANITGYSEPIMRNFWSIMGYTGLILSVLFSHIFDMKKCKRMILILSFIFTSSVFTIFMITNPIFILFILSITITGVRTLRPILRGEISRRTERPEYGIAIVNSVSNTSAGLFPLVVAIFMILL